MTTISTLGMNPARRRIYEAGIWYQQEKARAAAQRRIDVERRSAEEKEAATAVFRAAAAQASKVSRPMQIVREVAKKHGFTSEQIIGRSREFLIVLARQEAMWAVRKGTRLSLHQIGMHFDGRDHSTALHSISKHEQRLRNAPPRKDLFDRVTSAIAAAPEIGVSSEELRNVILASSNPPADVVGVLRRILIRIRTDLTFQSLRLVSTRPGNGWAYYRMEPVAPRLDTEAAAQGGGAGR